MFLYPELKRLPRRKSHDRSPAESLLGRPLDHNPQTVQSKPRAHMRKSNRNAQVAALVALIIGLGQSFMAQEFVPAPPPDRALIYVLDDQKRLAALPFEPGQTPLRPDLVAKTEKLGYVEIKGEHSATVLKADARFFLFTNEKQGTHPPFLVWLTGHRGARRVTALTQPGMRGFAIASEEIIKPAVRVLARDGDMVFMEVRPRASLVPGEYAIIGDDLTRIATFRVTEASPQ
jgi:hypothetical protein